jgi:hypothetical protein
MDWIKETVLSILKSNLELFDQWTAPVAEKIKKNSF